jgi:predicted nucleotidyltransferase
MTGPAMPDEAREQLRRLTSGLESILAADLVGVYLHGSLAFGCFNPQRSDVDVLAVTERPVADEKRQTLADLILASSGPKAHARHPPYPLEISLLTQDHLRPWRYPTRFDFHYGESHRARFEAGETRPLSPADHDLAAHITVLREVGVALTGRPVLEVFPVVPRADYVDSLLRDLAWSRTERLTLYTVLSASRVWATFVEDKVHSKLSGGLWALANAAAEFRPLIDRAVALYRGEDGELDAEDVLAYASYVEPLARSAAARYAAT